MKKRKIYFRDIPDKFATWTFIEKALDVKKFYDMKSEVNCDDIISLEHRLDINKLVEATAKVISKYPPEGWKHKSGNSPGYAGVSLTMNPFFKDDTDPNYQSLGDKNNPHARYSFHDMDFHKNLKNTFFDCTGFRKLTPCAEESDLKPFLTKFKRPLIRSRIAAVIANWPEDRKETGGWHQDEIIFENVRINIPIVTDESFIFEIKGQPQHHLPVGNAYTFESHLLTHRVFPTVSNNKQRIHLVLGMSPWFDYDPEEDSLTTNEFYGEMHPLDMIVNGYVHPDIGKKRD